MTAKIGILGASGYTGAELVRLVLSHPGMEIAALTADRKAGQSMGEVFPQLAHFELPVLQRMEDVDLAGLDLVFAALPHGLMHDFARTLPDGVKAVDLSADFRLDDAAAYQKWYGAKHKAMDLQPDAAFGLPEFYRDDIAKAKITANSGCHVVTSLLPVVPLLEAGVIDPDEIIIDTATGISGAGRGANEAMLFSETSDGFHAYGVAHHRHMGEFDQEFSKAAGRPVTCSFTPHLVPMIRGLSSTIHLKGDAEAVHKTLVERYKDEACVHVMEMGKVPQTRHVRGANLCKIGVIPDRIPGRVIVISVTDNLVKGASGQAVQCANVMLGLPETMGLTAAPLFP